MDSRMENAMNVQIKLSNVRKFCSASWDDFAKQGEERGDRALLTNHIFIDRGGDTLAVAHLDSHQKFERMGYINNKGRSKVYCGPLDDRLGAYVIADLLPSLGVVSDILFTDGEESGWCTSAHFKTDKEYKWIYEFDRGGEWNRNGLTDVAMYQFKTPEMTGILKEYGMNASYGLYTDICELDQLGCTGFNFNAAYYDYHSRQAWFDPDELQASVRKFMLFYDDWFSTHLPHTYHPKYTKKYGYVNPPRTQQYAWNPTTGAWEPVSWYNPEESYYGWEDSNNTKDPFMYCDLCGMAYHQQTEPEDCQLIDTGGYCKMCLSMLVSEDRWKTCGSCGGTFFATMDKNDFQSIDETGYCEECDRFLHRVSEYKRRAGK